MHYSVKFIKNKFDSSKNVNQLLEANSIQKIILDKHINHKDSVSKIKKFQPDFLWVSLGLPKQENWIMKYKDQLDVKFCIGVGAAFDFHTGNIKRAPIFYQKLGLEWLYRTAFESRLYIRQLRGFKFMIGTMFNNKTRF